MVNETSDKYDIDDQTEEKDAPKSTLEKTPTGSKNYARMRRRRQTVSETSQTMESNKLGDTFGVDAADHAKGNFLITIGFPGSGKSTFHSHIYRMCEEIHHVDPLHATGQQPGTVDPIMESRLNAWRRKYHTREQVDRTAEGEVNIFEIAFKITPKTRPKLPLDMRIIEVSGEDLKSLDNSASGTSAANIPQSIGALLNDKRLNERQIIIALMVDTDPEADPIEFLVDGLLSYMNVHGPRRLKSTKFCLILPKPMKMLEALKEYKEQFPDLWARLPRTPTLEVYRTAKDIDGSLASFYLSIFKKNMVQRLKTVAPPNGLMRTQFYLGEIEIQYDDEEGQEVPVEVLTTINYRDAATVFSYIYEGFTQRKLKPSFFDKLRGR